MSLDSRQRISTSCARILVYMVTVQSRLASLKEFSLTAHTRFFPLNREMISLSSPGDLGRGTAELWNPASLDTRLDNRLKRWYSSLLLHGKGSMYLENFNDCLYNTYRFLILLHSYRTTAGTQFISLALLVYFLLLDFVAAFISFPLSSH